MKRVENHWDRLIMIFVGRMQRMWDVLCYWLLEKKKSRIWIKQEWNQINMQMVSFHVCLFKIISKQKAVFLNTHSVTISHVVFI